MISIIVPVYNCEALLESCLDSLVAQTYKDFEVLIVNDGSTDSSLSICRKYVDMHPGVFRLFSKENGGVSSARNLALDNVRGEYVCFVDADDYVHKEYLQRLYDLIVENGCEMSMCSYVPGNNEVIKLLSQGEIIGSIFNFEKNAALCNKLFLSDKIGDLRFDENVFLGEDTLFCVEYAKKCDSAVFVNENLYYYEQSTSSLKYRSSAKYIEKNMSCIESRRKMLENTAGLDQDTIAIICTSLMEMFEFNACLAVIYNQLSVLKRLSADLKKDKRNYGLMLSSECKLLKFSPLLYFIYKKACQKGDAIRYRIKKMVSV